MPKPNTAIYNRNKWCCMLGIPSKVYEDDGRITEKIMQEFSEDCIGEKPFHQAKGFRFYAIPMEDRRTGIIPVRGLGNDGMIIIRSYTIVIENINEPYGSVSLDNTIRVLYPHDDIHTICRGISQKLQVLCDTKYKESQHPRIKYIYYFDRRFKDEYGLPHLYNVYMENLGFLGDVASFGEYERIVNGFDEASNHVMALEYYDKFSKDGKVHTTPEKFYVELYNTVLLSGALTISACAAEESNIKIMADNLTKLTPRMWSARFYDERSLCDGIVQDYLEKNNINAKNVSDFFASCTGQEEDDNDV